MASPLIHENIWFEKSKYEAAERQYYERLSKVIEEALKTVELSIELRNILKLKEEANMPKALNKSSPANETVQPPTTVTGNGEKRSKNKRNKNKKEKDAKNEQKLAGGNFSHDNIQSSSDNHVADANQAKGKTENQSEDMKGQPAVGEKGSNLHCPSLMSVSQVTNNFSEAQNASSNPPMNQSLASEVAKARQHIKQSLECMDGIAVMAGNNVELINRINSLEKENATLHKVVADLKNLVISLDGRVKSLEGGKPATAPAPAKTPKKEEDDDDGVDLFGSDSEEESEEAAKVREARLAAYAEKKSKKAAIVAKSSIILSVSPWDDETDMKKLEECVRSIEMDGLLWGASQLVPLAYGIHKLHISCVVEDDKVSVDLLQEKITEFEDYVQSADIAAFNKV